MSKSTTFGAPFLRYLLPPSTKILRPRIYFRVKTTDIENKYDLYLQTCSDESSMPEVVDFTVLYTPVASILSLHIIISIASEEVLIIFVLDISNSFQNTIIPNHAEKVYLSLPHIYLDGSKTNEQRNHYLQ